jgi:uncharacterized protein (DUF433 family)/DNA-binding transcriptional MerR regulator
MSEDALNVVGAFDEDQVVRLTGVSKTQLRYWDRTNFYRPKYATENRREPFSRVYSFKDVVSLRVLNTLRNQFGVSLQHLREVREKLAHLADERWTGVRLSALNRRVIWLEPDTEKVQEVISGQFLVDISLGLVISDTKKMVDDLNRREGDLIGRIEKVRSVNHSEPVVAGTRIPVRAIKNFAAAGYSLEQIQAEYPTLTLDDIKAAITFKAIAAVA